MAASFVPRQATLLLLLVSACSSTILYPQEDISPDGILFATPDAAKVRLSQTRDDKLVRSLSGGHEAPIRAVHFSEDGDRLVSGDLDGRIVAWNPKEGTILGRLMGHQESIEQFAVRRAIPDLASASGDGTIKLWDLKGRKEIRTLKGHQEAVYSVAFSPDGRRLVSTSKDRTIKLWELETGKELRTLIGHDQGVRAATFDETGSRLASGSDDGNLKVWDLETGRELCSMKGSKGPVLNLFFSQDGRHLLAYQSIQGGVLSIWRVADGEQVVENYFLEAPVAPRNWPYRAVFEGVASRAAHRP